MVAQVEGVALPATGREIAEIPLPGPRSGELAVEEQQRLPARAPLGQPRFDVEPSIEELDFVLPDRAPAWRRQLGMGQDLLGGQGHRAHHSWGLMTRPERALG